MLETGRIYIRFYAWVRPYLSQKDMLETGRTYIKGIFDICMGPAVPISKGYVRDRPHLYQRNIRFYARDRAYLSQREMLETGRTYIKGIFDFMHGSGRTYLKRIC